MLRRSFIHLLLNPLIPLSALPLIPESLNPSPDHPLIPFVASPRRILSATNLSTAPVAQGTRAADF